jgi:hypothetical protein
MSSVGAQVRDVAPTSTKLRLVWAGLLALTTLATMVSVLTIPFEAHEAEFVHALRSGEVRSVALGRSADFSPEYGVTLNSSGVSDDIAVAWVNRFGFRRVAALTDLRAVDDLLRTAEPAAGAVPSSRQLDPAGSIAATARALGADPPTVVAPRDLPLEALTRLSPGVMVLMIVIMLGGPRPRRMSKAGAFWAYLAPFNIGIFYALLRDSPWNRRMNLLPEPGPSERMLVDPATDEGIRRRGGWNMFVWAFVIGNIMVNLLLATIGSLLPNYLDPVVWTTVDVAGTVLTR